MIASYKCSVTFVQYAIRHFTVYSTGTCLIILFMFFSHDTRHVSKQNILQCIETHFCLTAFFLYFLYSMAQYRIKFDATVRVLRLCIQLDVPTRLEFSYRL